MQKEADKADVQFVAKKPGNPVICDEDTRAKADLTKAANARRAAFARVQKIVPLIEQARKEMLFEKDQKGHGDSISDAAFANWLNRYAKRRKSRRYLANNGDEWKPTKIRHTIFCAPDRMIFLAVLECRTRMFEISERADFEKCYDEMHDIEKKYLGFMADAIDLEHRLNGNRKRSRAQLLEEARHRAVDFTEEQRRKKPLSMTARYLFWDHDPPFVEMAFGKIFNH